MLVKLYCPHCGRCLGECNYSDQTSTCRVLINPPARLSKKSFVHDMKCIKCKNQIYIVMSFKE